MPCHRTVGSATLAVLIASGAALGLSLHHGGSTALADQPQKDSQKETRKENARPDSPISKDKLRYAIALSDAFKEISRTVSPSVVNIRSITHLKASTHEPQFHRRPLIPEDLLPRLFGGDDDENAPEIQAPRQRERMGEGSGVIIREDGYIVTNNHVVDDADEILVKLADDREFKASVLGVDKETDLAVVHIEASGLSAAKLGDSDDLEPGEWVLAMGSPFGLEHTITAGIVSAKGREIGIIRDSNGNRGYEDFIQTDAAINPGNSGGPLVNIYGEVVGINTAISTQTGTYNGVGFAIPSKMVKAVSSQIIENGHVERGWLGVGIQPLSRDLAESLGLDNTKGVLINMVSKGSPAEAAGILVEDVITKIDGVETTTPTDLMNRVAAAKPGSTVNLELIRDREKTSVIVKLAQRSVETIARGKIAPAEPASNDLGVAVKTLTPDIAHQVGASDVQGVVVTSVDPDSPADIVGMEPGDVVTQIGETPIGNVGDFNAAMKQQDLSKGVRLHVMNQGQASVIVLKSSQK